MSRAAPSQRDDWGQILNPRIFTVAGDLDPGSGTAGLRLTGTHAAVDLWSHASDVAGRGAPAGNGVTPPAPLTVLVVEDDSETREVVAAALTAEGRRVLAVGRAVAASQALRAGDVDAAILDVFLPDGNGIELCRQWRRDGLAVPILVLTARGDIGARVEGLDAGADDYLVKPFAVSELRARVRALLRRARHGRAERVFEHGPLRVNFARREVRLAGAEVPLTRRELDVLERLCSAGGHAVARDDLLEDVWGDATPKTAASLEVIVARLRHKLEPMGAGTLIRTLRGFGYALAGRTGEPER